MTIFIGNFHPVLGLLALISYIIVGFILPVIVAKTSKKYGESFREEFGIFDAFMLDSLRGVKESIQYGTGEKRLKDIYVYADSLSSKEKKLKDAAGTSSALANLGTGLQNTLAAGNRVLDILDEAPVIHEVINGKDIHYTSVNCNDIEFAYDDELILKDFSMNIPEKGIIGIVGKSGSGKSTLLKLIMRFFDTDKGTITISNENIKNINTSSLRTNESYVTQDTVLFHDTIKNNLLIAKPQATDEEIIEACKKASIMISSNLYLKAIIHKLANLAILCLVVKDNGLV